MFVVGVLFLGNLKFAPERVDLNEGSDFHLLVVALTTISGGNKMKNYSQVAGNRIPRKESYPDFGLASGTAYGKWRIPRCTCNKPR